MREGHDRGSNGKPATRRTVGLSLWRPDLRITAARDHCSLAGVLAAALALSELFLAFARISVTHAKECR